MMGNTKIRNCEVQLVLYNKIWVNCKNWVNVKNLVKMTSTSDLLGSVPGPAILDSVAIGCCDVCVA